MMTVQYAPALSRLKHLLSTNEEHHVVATFFVERLGNVPGFHDEGDPVDCPDLAYLMVCAVKGLTGHEPQSLKTRIVYLESHEFYHGPCQVNGLPGNVFYFSDIQTGIMCVAEPEAGRTWFMRLTQLDFEHPVTAYNPEVLATD